MSVIIGYDRDGDEFIIPRNLCILKQTSEKVPVDNGTSPSGMSYVKESRYWVVSQPKELWEITGEVYKVIKEKLLTESEENDIICEIKNNEGEEG